MSGPQSVEGSRPARLPSQGFGRVIVPQGEAEEGSFVLGEIRRYSRAARREGATGEGVIHVAAFHHRYGPDEAWIWAEPICGGRSGRLGERAPGLKICGSCRRAAAREGVTFPEEDS